VAVLYARRLGDEIVFPGHVIDVDLHDAVIFDGKGGSM